jgi:hypothetical protein
MLGTTRSPLSAILDCVISMMRAHKRIIIAFAKYPVDERSLKYSVSRIMRRENGFENREFTSQRISKPSRAGIQNQRDLAGSSKDTVFSKVSLLTLSRGTY